MDAYDLVMTWIGYGSGTVADRPPSGKRILLFDRARGLHPSPKGWPRLDVLIHERFVPPDKWYDGDYKPLPRRPGWVRV